MSFMQTGAKSDPAGKALEADSETVVDAGEAAKQAFRTQENKLMDLHRESEKKLADLHRSLEEQQPVLSDKLEMLSETNRTLLSTKRTLARDQALLGNVKASGAYYVKAEEEQDKFRKKESTLIRSAIAMLKATTGTAALMSKDIRSLDDNAAPAALLSRDIRSLDDNAAPSFIQIDGQRTVEQVTADLLEQQQAATDLLEQQSSQPLNIARMADEAGVSLVST